MEALHEWCRANAYDYEYSFNRSVFFIHRPGRSFAVTERELRQAQCDVGKLLDAICARLRQEGE